MGDAKKRTAMLATWVETLSVGERKVFSVATAAHEKIVKALGATGMCYRMAFFMTAHLSGEFGIGVEPVVGYVNDGTDDLMISHAWVEMDGKKTDISLTITEHAETQLTGPLLILDREMTKGSAVYTYHRERSAEAARQVEGLLKNMKFRDFLLNKEAEHQRMVAVARDMTLMKQYLNAAPDGLGYDQFARMIGRISS